MKKSAVISVSYMCCLRLPALLADPKASFGSLSGKFERLFPPSSFVIAPFSFQRGGGGISCKEAARGRFDEITVCTLARVPNAITITIRHGESYDAGNASRGRWGPRERTNSSRVKLRRKGDAFAYAKLPSVFGRSSPLRNCFHGHVSYPSIHPSSRAAERRAICNSTRMKRLAGSSIRLVPRKPASWRRRERRHIMNNNRI